MGKRSYYAKSAKGWKHSWHYDGPLGKALCGKSNNYSTDNISIVSCKTCLDKMLEGGIIDEKTYNELINNTGIYAKGTVQIY